MTGRPTQKQIAERLGLSTATVSLAMKDSPMIAAETRRLVREAMREAGYVPNIAAASLRTGRTRIVGVSFHNIAHQFFAEMLIAMEQTFGEAGAAVFLNNHGEDPASLARFVESLAAYGADGLLLSPPPDTDASVLAPLRARGVPVIYFSRYVAADAGADRVVNADRRAMATATRRLIDLGHRDLALIGGQPGTSVSAERLEGFREELARAGLPYEPQLWRQCRPRLVEGAAALRETLDWRPHPTGYVCFNDLVAFGVMNALRAAGLRPGREVGVVGIGGTEEAAAFSPSLTTVLDNPKKIGALAAEMLLERLATPALPPRHVTLEPKLMIRESCGGPVA
ncbi:MAG: LacI family DNA-binding transcriptional regulator [Pseudomonadota bacterium]